MVRSYDPDANLLPSQFQSTVWTLDVCTGNSFVLECELKYFCISSKDDAILLSAVAVLIHVIYTLASTSIKIDFLFQLHQCLSKLTSMRLFLTNCKVFPEGITPYFNNLNSSTLQSLTCIQVPVTSSHSRFIATRSYLIAAVILVLHS